MGEMLDQPSARGELRYYKLSPDMLDPVHDELERMGVTVWDGGVEIGRVGGDGGASAEIAVLDDNAKERVSKLGGQIVEISPHQSFLHEEYIRYRQLH